MEIDAGEPEIEVVMEIDAGDPLMESEARDALSDVEIDVVIEIET
jgi:hypothetical protein